MVVNAPATNLKTEETIRSSLPETRMNVFCIKRYLALLHDKLTRKVGATRRIAQKHITRSRR